MRWTEHAIVLEDEKCIQVLMGEPEGKRQLWKPRLRWEDNIKTHLKETMRLCGLE